MLLKQTITAFCLLVAASVVLNGAHFKDLMAFDKPFSNVHRGDDQSVTKVVGDLHPHVDKQVGKVSQDAPTLDGRSLRLRDYKRIQLGTLKNWLNSWRDQLSLFIS